MKERVRGGREMKSKGIEKRRKSRRRRYMTGKVKEWRWEEEGEEKEEEEERVSRANHSDAQFENSTKVVFIGNIKLNNLRKCWRICKKPNKVWIRNESAEKIPLLDLIACNAFTKYWEALPSAVCSCLLRAAKFNRAAGQHSLGCRCWFFVFFTGTTQPDCWSWATEPVNQSNQTWTSLGVIWTSGWDFTASWPHCANQPWMLFVLTPHFPPHERWNQC